MRWVPSTVPFGRNEFRHSGAPLFAVATSSVVKLQSCLKVAMAKITVRKLSIEKKT